MATDLYYPPISAYPSPLTGYEGLPPLSEEKTADGKSLVNPTPEKLSSAYETFIDPLDKGRRGGFDIHIYYYQTNKEQTAYARALYERIRREFPELRIYRFWDRPVGPHPVAMFEVNLFTPAQFGAFIPWLAIWRGPLSALVHPNTTEGEAEGDAYKQVVAERRNHSQRAIWLGERVPLDFTLFDAAAAQRFREAQAAKAAAEEGKKSEEGKANGQ